MLMWFQSALGRRDHAVCHGELALTVPMVPDRKSRLQSFYARIAFDIPVNQRYGAITLF